MHDGYVVYGAARSLFTRKLEAALRFYGARFELRSKTPEDAAALEARAGTHQIPLLGTPEGWLLADTTPILDLLDARFPRRRMFPEGELGVLVHAVEEILDEWVARVMVHFRWHRAENTRAVIGEWLGREVGTEEASSFPTAQWGRRACRATGTESEHQQLEAEREYLALLGALEEQLGATRYALGDRPCAADAMLLGGLRAHTNADPYPDLSGHPRVLRWEASLADAWDGEGALAEFPGSTPFAAHVLALGRACYADFLLGNAGALAQGRKAFVVPTYGEPVSYLCRPYPERSRRLLQARIRDRLDAESRERVAAWLEQQGLACFLPGARPAAS